jgi:hypothetical protein
MTPRTGLQQFARAVGRARIMGAVLPELQDIGAELADQPQAMHMLIELVTVEARKKRPNEDIQEGCIFLFAEGLARLRQRAESGQGFADGIIESLQINMSARLKNGKLSSGTASALAAAFARAQVEIGEDIRGLLNTQTLERLDTAPQTDMPRPDVSKMFADLAASCDHDPFVIHSSIDEMTSVMPAEQKMMLAAALVICDEPSLREATLGWLLCGDASTRAQLASVFAETGAKGLISLASQARLRILRNLLPEQERGPVDAIIRAGRGKAGAPPAATAAVQIKYLLMSARDGAGAQSVYAVIKQGRQQSLVAVMVKQGFGVRDAFCTPPAGSADIEDMLDRISIEVHNYETSAEAVTTLISHALAENWATQASPPFALVQVIEKLSLPNIAPNAQPVEDFVAAQLADLDPALTDAAATKRALNRSKQWIEDHDGFDSWFENDDEAMDIMDKVRGKAKRVEALLTLLLPKRRAYWGASLAWTALALRDDSDADDWRDMMLVARDMLGDRPLAEIPLARLIAEQSVAAADYV